MNTPDIFVLQFVLSLIAWSLIAKWYFLPSLGSASTKEALAAFVLPHTFRHIGMVFLVPGVVARPLAEGFAAPAAYGDLLAGLLAVLALVTLRAGWKGAIGLVWLFNVVGTVDLLNALRHLSVAPDFGAAWYIPTFLVPLLLVTHFLIFARLLKGLH